MLHVIIMQLLHPTRQHASLLTPPLQLACNVALAADAAACGAGARQKLGDAQVQFYAAVLAFEAIMNSVGYGFIAFNLMRMILSC